MKQMRKKLLLVGILAVTLSTISATQYVRADLGFSYEIVHPSDADIRYIGSDNAGDGLRVLRSEDNQTVKLWFGNWSAGQTKVYTAAFGIVNEERFPVKIKDVIVEDLAGAAGSHMQIWLHGIEDTEASNYTNNLFWNGTGGSTSNTWILAPGNQDSTNMHGENIPTPFDDVSQVRYATNTSSTEATSGNHDFVWVQIVITAPNTRGSFEGNIRFTFESTTELP
jgi:hypothetical protein